MEQKENNLLDFSWDNDDEQIFDITPTDKDSSEDIDENVEDENDDENSSDSEPKNKKTETSNKKEDIENDDEDTQEEALRQEVSIYTDLYKDLKESGIIKHIDVEDITDLSKEDFENIQEEEYEAEVSERLKTWATEELDEDARAFINFKRKGGSTKDFFNTYNAMSGIPQGDIEDEDYQDDIIRYQLKQEDWDSEEIEDRLEYLTENNKKAIFAKKCETKVREKERSEKEQLEQDLEIRKTQQKEEEERITNTIKDKLKDTTELGGFVLKQADKDNLINFITKRSVKVDNKVSITPLQKKLAEVFKDTDKLLLLSMFLNKDFDTTGIKIKAKSEKVKEINSHLEQRRRYSHSFGSSESKSLADLFEN